MQQHVVHVLHPDSGVFAENIQWIQDFLEVYQPDFPRPPLLLDHSFQGVGGGTVAASGIEENEVQPLFDVRSRPGIG